MKHDKTLNSLCALLIALVGAATVVAQTPTRPAQDMRVYLRAMVFDPAEPLAEIAPRLQMSASAKAATERRIIQFREPLTRAQRAMLTEQYGLKLTDYVPNYAYVERISSDMAPRLKELDLVRAIVAYQPVFKVSPEMGEMTLRTEARQSMPGLLVRAVLFDDADSAAVAAALESIAGIDSVDLRDFSGSGAPARIQFVATSQEVLPDVAQLDGVRWIEEVAEQDEDNGRSAGTIQSGTQGIVPIWDQGIHGENQVVGVIDSGPLDINHCMFSDPGGNVPGPGHRKMLGLGAGGASQHATVVAGIAAGDNFNNPGGGANRGNAWAARMSSRGRGGGVLAALMANMAEGATIHTNSWHDNTQGAGNPATYNQTASDVDAFCWANEDHLVFGSMGNNGEEQGPPGTAKNAVGVNASQFDPNENNVGDGNPGPTADGRRKPDIVTPGCSITSAQVGTACTITLDSVIYGFGPICATSWATPAAAASSALVRQYYTDGFYPTGTAQAHHGFNPPGALVKATLLNATIDMTGVAGYPANNEGWGLARLDNSLVFPGGPRALRAWHERNSTGLATGETVNFSVTIDSAAEPLKVTLVWTEPPGAAGALNPVINNLDLRVVSPTGTVFRGNVFGGGQSVAGGAADTLNNVEQVLINAPAVGAWTLQVVAPAVNVGVPGQGYALVATGPIIPDPEIQVPGDLHFPDTCSGSASHTTLNVCNTGDGDLSIDPIGSSDAQFAVTVPSGGYPVIIGPDFCFPFQASFDPAATGAQSAMLTIPSTDPSSPSTNVQAFGTGTEQNIEVTGSTEFGVTSAWLPAEKTVTVCNTGECRLAVASAVIGCADFSLVADPLPVDLQAGSCIDLVVEFTPALPGPKSCQLTINSDDPDAPAVVRTLTAQTPPSFSLHTGLVDSHGALSAVADSGSTLQLDFVRPFSPKWAWDVRLGHSRFDGQPGFADTKLWALSANAKFTFNPAAAARFFVNGGLGVYHFDPGDFEGGANLGLGLNVPAGAHFDFEATYNYHSAFTAAPDLEFDQVQLGFLVSF
jgi:hypothetical protein